MTAPSISVVIPSYNCARYLGATLDSVLAQNYPDVELIVIDDGSTDATPEVAEQYCGRIVYQRMKNGGLAAARNAGMRIAKGEYIAWLDADDLCEPGRLALQSAYLAAHPEVVAVGSSFAAFDDSGIFDESHAAHYYGQVRTHGLGGLFQAMEPFAADGLRCNAYSGDVWERLLFGNFIHPPTLMLRRSARERVGWLRNGIRYAEDWDYILRLAEVGKLGVLDLPLLRYRCHPGQMSNENAATTALNSLRVLESQIAEHPDRIAAMRSDLNERFAECHATAAYALADRRQLEALGHLFLATHFDRRRVHFWRNFARIAAGRHGLELLRNLRSLPTLRS